MTESDKKYYERQSQHEQRRNRALSMAKARGEAAEEWFKTHTLNSDTQPEFNKLMKSIDKNFK